MKNKKTIEDQGKKQFDVLNTLKPIKDNKSADNKNLSKSKEIFEELSNERMREIQNISEKIDFNNLTYHFESPNLAPISFIGFRGTLNIYNEIKKTVTYQ